MAWHSAAIQIPPPQKVMYMEPIPHHLSIWELAHCWQGVVPHPEPSVQVSREIRDKLLVLIEAVLDQKLCIYEILPTVITREDGTERPGGLYAMDIVSIPEGFEKMHSTGILDRELLQGFSVNVESLFLLCIKNNFEVPDFCIPDWAISSDKSVPTIQTKLRPDQQDKATCQAIARRIWSQHPDMTIADMTKRHEIRIEGNGQSYPGKDTVRNWLKVVAPAPVRNRRGRPKKKVISEKPPS